MIDVGRKKWSWPDLPPRMTARRLASGKVLYYYQAAGKKIPLGANRVTANEEWARHEAGVGLVRRFPQISADYRKATFPTFSVSTRGHYETALNNLDLAFKAFTLEQIEPRHIKDYMRRRTRKGAAIFEKRVGSTFFNWAREEGHTRADNPFRGVKFSKAESRAYGIKGKRDVYVTDEQFQAVYDRGDAILQDAMDLAILTGQRPSDLLKARRQDIVDGVLWFTQVKTGHRMGLRVEGELASVLARILSRERAVPSMYLLCDRNGQRLLYGALNDRFNAARGAAIWQFRDIRAKAATDSPDLKRAQELLGHAQETTTTVYRRSKGKIVSPLQR
jgi:integrase